MPRPTALPRRDPIHRHERRPDEIRPLPTSFPMAARTRPASSAGRSLSPTVPMPVGKPEVLFDVCQARSSGSLPLRA